MGTLTLIETETGLDREVDNNRKGLRERFAQAAAEQRATIGATIRGAGAHHLRLRTDEDWLLALARHVATGRRRHAVNPGADDALTGTDLHDSTDPTTPEDHPMNRSFLEPGRLWWLLAVAGCRRAHRRQFRRPPMRPVPNVELLSPRRAAEMAPPRHLGVVPAR
jgi:hypothetical protein